MKATLLKHLIEDHDQEDVDESDSLADLQDIHNEVHYSIEETEMEPEFA